MGCPPLRSEAYEGARLSTQLDDQGVRFVRESSAKNRVDVANRVWYHSLIFGTYKEDFGGSVKHAARYAARWYPEGPEKQLLLSGEFKSGQTDYDWTLNSRDNFKRAARPEGRWRA